MLLIIKLRPLHTGANLREICSTTTACLWPEVGGTRDTPKHSEKLVDHSEMLRDTREWSVSEWLRAVPSVSEH